MKILFAFFSIVLFSVNFGFCSATNLESINSENIKQVKTDKPVNPGQPAPVVPPDTEIAVYRTDEEFSFESEARQAMQSRVETFKAAGISALGGSVIRKENKDYTFIVEYIPTVKHGQELPPAAIIDSYRSGAIYWRESDAVEALVSAKANFQNAGVQAIDGYVYDIARDHSFALDYVVKNLLRYTPVYDVQIKTYEAGMYDFESEAEAAAEEYAARFRQAGIPVIRGKAFRRPDRDYSIMLEYAVKTNKYGNRPQFSIKRYDASDVYSFESEALEAMRQRMALFNEAGVNSAHGFARKVNRDYSFTIDYFVKNIYQSNTVTPSAVIKIYQAPETFDFEVEAEKAMLEKAENFNNAGFFVIHSRVVESGRDYSYLIEYITRLH
ncbi:MAG: hypothetical protein HY746_04750 [Elusimicrobia bacterium]|nr:hypothetical protein [Elusimicrobiota bacterium]